MGRGDAASSPCICLSPGAVLSEVSPEARVATATGHSDAATAHPPQLALPEGESSLLGSDQEPVLTGRRARRKGVSAIWQEAMQVITDLESVLLSKAPMSQLPRHPQSQPAKLNF